ncbi:hypothetical protein DH2020_046899 [Rehmannia glutinosa]|uniref:Retrovirus-related Pol polyprotein from transposon RE1 n=1 Tax=Rehmannia glutinosa TaxID=99300 RepID=A0ABR0UAU3_REHGL
MASSASSVSSLTLPTFAPISIQLDRSNYFFWRTQILSNVRAHAFDGMLFGAAPPQPSPSSSNGVTDSSMDVQALHWHRRDQFLFSWLLSTISETMLGHVSRCTSSAELWSVLESLFHTQSKARVMHLRNLLLNTKKGDSTIEEYFLKMRSIVDNLHVVGKIISDEDLISYILAGCGSEYEAVIVNLSARVGDISLQDAQYALQTHDMHIQQLSNSVASTVDIPFPTPSAHAMFNGVPKRGSEGFSLRGGFSRGRGRGRFNKNHVVCQICGKANHIASKCFKRFDSTFQGKQDVAARSSTEFEYRALATATTDLIWIKSLFSELGLSLVGPSILWCDNASVIALASNPVFHACTKHIEVDVHYIREKVHSKEVEVRFVPSEDQIADFLTKPLSVNRFQFLCTKFSLSTPQGLV